MEVFCIFVSLVVAVKADYHEEIGIPLAARIKAFEDEIFNEEPETKLRAADGEFVKRAVPYLVGLIIQLENNQYSMCAGALLSKHHVVTTAQCMVRTKIMTAVLGSTYLYHGGIRITTYEYKIHPYFNQSRSLDYDIAKIKLSQKVKFSDTIQVVYQPTTDAHNETLYEWAVAAGYGLPNDNTYFMTYWRTRVSRVRLRIIQERYCHDNYNITQVVNNNVCTSGHIVAGMCRGDGGAPLVVERSGLTILIGLYSYGPIRCQMGHPDAFTRIATYRNFVQQWETDE